MRPLVINFSPEAAMFLRRCTKMPKCTCHGYVHLRDESRFAFGEGVVARLKVLLAEGEKNNN